MTGAVTWEVLMWAVGLIIAAGLGVSGFLLWLWSIVKGLREDFARDLAQLEAEHDEKIRKQDLRIEASDSRLAIAVEVLGRDMGEYKTHAAETFASKDGVNAGLKRVEDALARMTAQFDGSVKNLTERIDRVLLERREG